MQGSCVGVDYFGDFAGGGWDQDPLHAGGFGGLDADLGVFEDEAFFRGDAEAAGGFEEGVGRGLAVDVILGADDCVEFIGDAQGVEGLEDYAAVSAGSDGHGAGAVVLVYQLDYGLDGEDLRDHLYVDFLFFQRGFPWGQGGATTFVEDFHDFFGGGASQFVKEGLGENAGVILQRSAPCHVMQGHGIGQSAVAIEDVAIKISFR